MPSGLNATDQTPPLWPVQDGGRQPGCAQIPQLDGATSLPEARGLPSGLNATDQTSASWPAQDDGVGLGLTQIPQPDGGVPTARGQALAIRAERHRRTTTLVAAQDRGASLGVPRSHSRTVLSSPPEARRAIRAERHRRDRTLMATQDAGVSPGRAQLPQPDGVVVTARGQALAIRAERHRLRHHLRGRVGLD